MRREVTLEEISDGRLYEANDMVKADCQDCKGCFDCCTGMGDSVVLDPLDVWRLSQGLHLSVDQLLAGKIELGVTDGNILPHLRMTGAEERCVFLMATEDAPSTAFVRASAVCSRWEDTMRTVVLNTSFRSTSAKRPAAVRSRSGNG